MLRYLRRTTRKMVLAKMARPFTTTRSLESLQPRKEPRHGHGRRIAAGSQEVGRDTGAQGQRQAFGDPRGRRVPVACRENVLLAGGWGCTLRSPTPGSDQPLLVAATLAEARYQQNLAGAVVAARGSRGRVRVHYRRYVDHPGRQENAEHLQYGQPSAAAAQRTPLRQEQTRPQELPQLHDRPLDHAVGHPDSLLQAVSHARVLQADWLETPHHSRGGSRSDSRTAATGRGKSDCAGRYGVRLRSGPRRLQGSRLPVDFSLQPRVAFWLARKGSGPRCVRS